MPMELSFFAAVLVGLLGSSHCLGMCGGIVTALDTGIDDRAATGKLLTELSGADAITIELLDGQTISLDATQVATLRQQAGQ